MCVAAPSAATVQEPNEISLPVYVSSVPDRQRGREGRERGGVCLCVCVCVHVHVCVSVGGWVLYPAASLIIPRGKKPGSNENREKKGEEKTEMSTVT